MPGNDAEFIEFVNEMINKQVDAVFFIDANPAYNYHNPKGIKKGLEQVRFKSVLRGAATTKLPTFCNVIAPNHHYLESWG